MIRNSKNIKKIKLLYSDEKSNSDNNNNNSKKAEPLDSKLQASNNESSKTETISMFPEQNKLENINSKYIKQDIIKTSAFVIFAIIILYLVYHFNLFAMIFTK